MKPQPPVPACARSRPFARWLIGLLVLGLLSCGATAATFTVTNLNDSGAGSLRQAVFDANASADQDTIVFGPGTSGILNLLSTIEITNPVEIIGPGRERLIISGPSRGTQFRNTAPASAITLSEVVFSGLTLTTASTGIDNRGRLRVSQCSILSQTDYGIDHNGGIALTVEETILAQNNYGIYSRGSLSSGVEGDLQVTASTLSRNRTAIRNDMERLRIAIEDTTLSENVNSSRYAPAIRNTASTASVRLSNSRVLDNQYTYRSNRWDRAGAIYSTGALTIENTTLAGNLTNFGNGGAIRNNGGTLALTNSTLSGNAAGNVGGAIVSVGRGATLMVRNTTIVGNAAPSGGGGIYNGEGSVLSIGNSLVIGNTASGAGSSSIHNANPTFFSFGHNLYGENGHAGLSGMTAAASDRTLAGALATAVTELGDHGGPTQTHLLVAGSPALDAGDNSLLPTGLTTDQRGAERIQNGTVDIGAVEGTQPLDGPQAMLTATKTGNGRLTSAPAGIDCGSSCTANFTAGQTVTLTATPDSGYRVGSWGGACADTAASSDTCTLTLDADQSASVEFVAAWFSLSVSKSGNGQVVSSPAGIDCGRSCTESFIAGQSVTLTATPDSSATFTGWGGACSGTSPTCTLTLNAGVSVLANFAPTQQDLDPRFLSALYVTTFMETLAGPGVMLNDNLRWIFASILARQLDISNQQVTERDAFEQLARVFTFVASPSGDRPAGPFAYDTTAAREAAQAAVE